MSHHQGVFPHIGNLHGDLARLNAVRAVNAVARGRVLPARGMTGAELEPVPRADGPLNGNAHTRIRYGS